MDALDDPPATPATAQRLPSDRLAGVVDAVADPITVQDAEGRVVFANRAAARASGLEHPDQLVSGEPTVARFDLFDETGRVVDPNDLPGRLALRTGKPQSRTLRYRARESGTERWARISAVPLPALDAPPDLAVNIIHDVTETKAIEDALRVSEARSRLLADATRDLDESLDLERTIRTAMTLAVPGLADWATLDLVRPDGTVERVAAEVADPSLRPVADRLRAFAVEPGMGRAGDRVISERRVVIARLGEPPLVPDPRRPGLMEALEALGTTAAMAVPLVARGTVEGVLVLGASHDSRRYEEKDAVYATDLGRRIALAVGNARLYTAELAARHAAEAAVVRAEAVLADLEVERNRFEAIIRQLPSGVIVAEAPSGRTIIVNEAVGRILGVEAAAARDDWERELDASHPDGTPYAPESWPLERTIRTGEAVAEEDIRIHRPDGTTRWVASRAAPILDAHGVVVAGIAVFEDITGRREQRQRAEFLSRASAVLASSLDVEATVKALAEMAVPSVADWSAVDAIGDDGELHGLALAHSDPRRIPAVEALRAALDAAGLESTAARVIRTGTGEVLDDFSPETLSRSEIGLREAGVRPEVIELIRTLDLSSILCVPLIASGQAIGALTLATSGTERRLSRADLPFAAELAARAAAAIQNATLFRDGARFRTILDAVRDGVTIVDPTTLQITYANDAVLEQLGRTRDEVIGHTSRDWTEGLTADRLRELIAPLVSGELASRSLDVTRVRTDGSRIPVEIRWQSVELAGVGSQLVAISRDIRDRIATEQRLKELAGAEHARAAELNAIIRAIGEGLVVMDGEGRITLANPTAQGLLEPIEAWTLDAVVDRLEDPDGIARSAMTVPGVAATLRLRAPTAAWIEISNYLVPDAVPNGEHIVILRDVTQAREREAVRDAFVGILSHELRTPVTTIYAGAKVLARDETHLSPDARREIFDDIHVEAERLHRLVEDVVALTRFGEGALEIGNEPVLLQRVVPTVVRSEQARWPQGSFEMDLAPDLPPVSGDRTYVEQVIRNLLANAVKYGGTGATIRLVARAESPDEVSVRVLDEGPGFPEQEGSRLFELYYRSPSTSSQASGSGIGLFVCARLIDAMGGRIWASNRPEGGAEFGFALGVMPEEP